MPFTPRRTVAHRAGAPVWKSLAAAADTSPAGGSAVALAAMAFIAVWSLVTFQPGGEAG